MLLITYTLSVISGDAGDASSGFSGDAGGVWSLFIIFRMSACVRIFPSKASLTLTQHPFLGMHMNPKKVHAIGTYSPVWS